MRSDWLTPMTTTPLQAELIKKAKKSKSKAPFRMIALQKVLPEQYDLFTKRMTDANSTQTDPEAYAEGWTQAIKSMSSKSFDYIGTQNWFGITTVATITYDAETWEIVRTQGEWIE